MEQKTLFAVVLVSILLFGFFGYFLIANNNLKKEVSELSNSNDTLVKSNQAMSDQLNVKDNELADLNVKIQTEQITQTEQINGFIIENNSLKNGKELSNAKKALNECNDQKAQIMKTVSGFSSSQMTVSSVCDKQVKQLTDLNTTMEGQMKTCQSTLNQLMQSGQ